MLVPGASSLFPEGIYDIMTLQNTPDRFSPIRIFKDYDTNRNGIIEVKAP